MEIKTKDQLRDAIGSCREVRVLPRFGTSETWIRIFKLDALELLKSIEDGSTPEDCGMYSGMFGELENGILYLG